MFVASVFANDGNPNVRWSRTFDQPIAAAWRVDAPPRWVVALLDGSVHLLRDDSARSIAEPIPAMPGVSLVVPAKPDVLFLHDALHLFALDPDTAAIRWRTELRPPGTRDIDPEWRLRYLHVVESPTAVLTLASDGTIEQRDRTAGDVRARRSMPPSRYARLLAPSGDGSAAPPDFLAWHLAPRGELLIATPLFEHPPAPSDLPVIFSIAPLEVTSDANGALLTLAAEGLCRWSATHGVREFCLELESPISRKSWHTPFIRDGVSLVLFAISDDAHLRAYRIGSTGIDCDWAMPIESFDSTRLEADSETDLWLIDDDRYTRISTHGDILETGPAAEAPTRRSALRGDRIDGSTLYVSPPAK